MKEYKGDIEGEEYGREEKERTGGSRGREVGGGGG